MPRTKNPRGVNRDFTIRVRVTEEEYYAFKNRTYEHGCKTVSDFIRTLIKKEMNDDQQRDSEHGSHCP